jgi:hypothetical protein
MLAAPFPAARNVGSDLGRLASMNSVAACLALAVATTNKSACLANCFSLAVPTKSEFRGNFHAGYRSSRMRFTCRNALSVNE